MLGYIDFQSLVVFTIVFLICYLYWTTRLPEHFPPGPARLPVIGNLKLFEQNPTNVLRSVENLTRMYGPVVGLKFGSYPTVLLSGLEVIREALVNQADVFSHRPSWLYISKKLSLRNSKIHGILYNSGDSWKNVRRFTIMSLRDFGVGKNSIEGKIQGEADMLGRELHQFQGQPTDVATLIQEAVSNIICSICFGSRFEYTDPEFRKLMKMINYNISEATLTAYVNFVPLFQRLHMTGGLGKLIDNTREITAFIRKMIVQHRETYEESQPRDLLDIYLKNEKHGATESNISLFDIELTILEIFEAGTETTSTALRWLLLYMVRYPHVQAKCHEELDRAIGSRRPPRLSDSRNMPYTVATIHEMQRLGNVLPLALLHSANRSTTLCGYTIPKGTIVIPFIYSVNMDPEAWTKPEEFRPERWIDSEGNVEKRDHFIPFSVGPRVCLGESLAKNEIFLFFTSLMQKFIFKMAEPHRPPSMEGSLGVTLTPVSYKMIILER